MFKEEKDMKIIKGLNHYQKWEIMIKECCENAKLHPFEKYIIICDNPRVVEQRFFQYTHYLVNIEVITWNQFLKQLQINLHLTKHHIASTVELTYHLRNILKK